MLIECDNCSKEVDAKVLADHNSLDAYLFVETRISFLECPDCKHPLLAKQQKEEKPDGSWGWSDAIRVWPEVRKK